MKHLASTVVARLLPVLLNTRGKQRLSTLIYHRVLAGHDPMRPDEPSVNEFDWQMRLLRDNYNPLSLVDAVKAMQTDSLPERAVCVTFDDGYADNEQYALPVLKKYAIPATVFVSTGFINGGRMWNDSVIESVRIWGSDTLDLRDLDLGSYSVDSFTLRRQAAEQILLKIKHMDPAHREKLVGSIESRVGDLPRDLMMTDMQIRSLAENGIGIGAHTVNHPILASVTNEAARREIQGSKLHLEQLLQKEVDCFAYPNGNPRRDYTRVHRDEVESLGFRVAVSTHWGVATKQSDRFQLPRFTPWDRQELKFGLRLALNGRRLDPLIINDG